MQQGAALVTELIQQRDAVQLQNEALHAQVAQSPSVQVAKLRQLVAARTRQRDDLHFKNEELMKELASEKADNAQNALLRAIAHEELEALRRQIVGAAKNVIANPMLSAIAFQLGKNRIEELENELHVLKTGRLRSV